MHAALAVLMLLAASPSARAEGPGAAVVSTPQPSEEPLRGFGVSVDAGVPDGAGLSLSVRPWRWMRVSLGALTNGFAPGIRGGLTVVPFAWTVAPSLTLEAGRFAPGDANGLAARWVGDPSYHSGFLERVAYGFGNAHLGLELGKPNRWAVYLHGGYSHLVGTVESFAQGLSEASGETLTATPLHTRLTFPSAKLGFVLFLG